MRNVKKYITEINFYVNSDKVTETLISNDLGYSPIYLEQNGSVVNYYTKGEAYQLTNGYAYFSGLNNISSLDLTHFDASHCTNFCQMFSHCLNLKEIKLNQKVYEKIKSQLIFSDLNIVYNN